MLAYFPPKLRIAVLPVTKSIEVKRIGNTTIISGVEGEFIKLLARALNFEYEIIVPPDFYGEMEAYGNYTGMIGMLQRKEADMGFSYPGTSEELSKVMDSSVPYYNIEKTFTMNYAPFLSKTIAFTYPFSTITWILYFIALLSVSVLFRTLISPKDSIISVFFNFWGSSFGQGMSYNPRSMSRRIPLGIWLLYSYVLILCYSSVLLSVLTSPIRMKQIKDFKDLYLAVRVGKMECLSSVQTDEVINLMKSHSPHLRGLGEYIKKNDWFYDSLDFDKIPEHVAILGSPDLFRVSIGPPEKYFYSKDTFGSFHYGVAIRKAFCCKERLNTIVLRILSGGLYNTFKEDFLFKLDLLTNLNMGHSQSTLSSPLSLSNLNGVFIILGIGWGAGIIALMMEITYCRWLRPKQYQT
ncbi:probable glutamate receptor [Parasteatoda tepidariorum]|uniref:probable glutamate receptor n=1 Tax=Parasteatoda tepidariorum TaxID=114398 RepID=UPI001C71B647|nr:probable glutamate receptor [Parasteatoda tepidariorum]